MSWLSFGVALDLLTNSGRENDIEGIIEMNFAVDDEKFGERRTIDLKPGGRDEPVTNENKGEYVEYVGPLSNQGDDELTETGW